MTVLLVLLLALQSTSIEANNLEKRVFERINELRVKAKLKPLKADDKLAEVARAHSEDMAKRNYIAHVNPEGLAPWDRARAAGIECTFFAENLFQNNLYYRALTVQSQIVYQWNTVEKIAASSVTGWLDSPGHRANIFDPRATRTGIGVALAPDLKVYITQEFC